MIRLDAEKLARYARLDPKILRPISHCGSTGSSYLDPRPQSGRRFEDSIGERGARVGQALRLPTADLIHLVLLQAVLRTPRPDDCVSGWALIRPSDNWQHRLLLPTPIGAEPERLIQSANRNTVENNNADQSQQNDIRDKTL